MSRRVVGLTSSKVERSLRRAGRPVGADWIAHDIFGECAEKQVASIERILSAMVKVSSKVRRVVLYEIERERGVTSE